MFVIGGKELMSDSQVRDWEDMLFKLRIRQKIAGSRDPLLFHGTCQVMAAKIMENGFDPTTSWVTMKDPASGRTIGQSPCVYWTNSLPTAENAAGRKSSLENGFPVIFAARASDLAKTGRLIPDYCGWEIDTDGDEAMMPKDWRDSLDRFHALAALDCRIVPNLSLNAITPLDVRPDPILRDRRQHAWWNPEQDARTDTTRGPLTP